MAAKPEPVPGFAERLRSAREAADLTQVEAGEKSGVHHISIARFETGKHIPTIGSLLKLASAYGIEASDLLKALPPPPKRRKK